MIPVVLIGLLLLAPAPSRAEPDLPAAVGMRIAEVRVENGSRVPDAEVRSLLGVEPGDLFDPREVQGGLRRLAQKDEVRDALVEGVVEGGGLVLEVAVTAEPLVRSVDFPGAKALKESALRARVTTREDEPIREVKLRSDEKEIAALYREEGYPDAAVSARVVLLPGGHWARVGFEVEEGPPRQISRIQGDAEPVMDRERLEALLGLRPGSPASVPRLREGVKTLLEVLHREGYPEARVTRPKYRAEGDEAVLELPLEVGERVDVRVEGIDEWKARSLRETLAAQYGEPIDGDWAERTAGLLREELVSRGYRDAGVTAELGEAWGNRRVTFHLDRGPLVRLDRIEFRGNERMPEDRLRPYVSLLKGGFFARPPFTEEALQRDLQVLRDYYLSRGFLDAALGVRELRVDSAGSAAMVIEVSEGARYRFGEVRFERSEHLPAQRAMDLSGIVVGGWADPRVLEQARLRLLSELTGAGHGQARVSYTFEKLSDLERVDVYFRIEEGPVLRYGRVVVSGNARTRTHVILRELDLPAGTPWNPDAVAEGRRKLYRLGFFQRVEIQPLAAAPGVEERDVLVTVVEQDAGAFSFGLGYGTEEHIKGFAGVSHSNLLGTGRSLGTRADFDRFDQSYSVNFREPWFLGVPVAFNASLVKSYETRDSYDLSSFAVRLSLERQVTEHFHAALEYSLSSNSLSNVDEDAVLTREDAGGNYILSAVGPVVAWDSRDDAFNPRRGYYHTAQAEWAYDFLGSEVEYGRYLASASGFFTGGPVTLALLARGGVAALFGQTADLPINKRFFLGGRSSVRSFRRDELGPKGANGDPVGGDTMINLRSELRFPIRDKFAAALFWDAGNVWNRSFESVDVADLRHAVGPSFRYLTPVGPLALDVGFNPSPRKDEDRYEWFFTVGNVF